MSWVTRDRITALYFDVAGRKEAFKCIFERPPNSTNNKQILYVTMNDVSYNMHYVHGY